MAKWRRLTLTFVWIGANASAFAGNFVFLNPSYLTDTRAVVVEAKEKAFPVFNGDPVSFQNFMEFAQTLENLVAEKQRKQALKKVKAEDLEEINDAVFAKALNDFKDGLSAMADIAHQPLEKLLPSYDRWNRLETAVVKRGLDQRLAAYETRFGPDSEPINILEFVISQKYFAGDESGPAAWEPILRITPVQLTSSGEGLTSTAQLGMNYYFVNGSAPTVLQWLGASNHIGVSAAVQYLDDPGLFNAKGKPSFGIIGHFDRKEVGLSWDDEEDKIRLTLGYAFQFVPLVF